MIRWLRLQRARYLRAKLRQMDAACLQHTAAYARTFRALASVEVGL